MSDVVNLLSSGPSANRVDIAIVAEGYTQAEREKFIADAKVFLSTFLGSDNARLNAPFSNYQGFFNANALFFASAQSGTDQPNSGSFVRTYFEASQHGSDGRLLYGDSDLVEREVARAVGGDAHDIIIVLVNTPLYGGAGGSVAWASAGNSAASELALHEIGHSFAGLQDEYVDSAVASSFPLSATAFRNSAHVTDSLARVPWSAWLGFNDGELGTVGTYQGGYYRANGVWRATENSKMLTLGTPFSAPEKEAFALRYYQSIGDYLSVTSSIPGIYDPITPNDSLFKFTWSADNGRGVQTRGGNFDAYGAGLFSGSRSVKLVTEDNTGLIRTGLASTQQQEKLVLSAPVKQIDSASYVLKSDDSGAILQFSATANQINWGDLAAGARVYIDGGAGIDQLNLPYRLSDQSHFKLSQLASGAVILGDNLGYAVAAHDVESIRFLDYAINPAIYLNAQSVPDADLKTLQELYIAFFNRIPDADGLNYWINQLKSGLSLDQVGTAFYQGASEYTALTGYRSDMSHEEFINILYRNALGRPDGADAGGLSYWSNLLDSGKNSPGATALAILQAAHAFKGDANWGFVADLLDRKAELSEKLAVDFGINFLSVEDSITKGMQLASLVTPTDITAALTLIGIADGQISHETSIFG